MVWCDMVSIVCFPCIIWHNVCSAPKIQTLPTYYEANKERTSSQFALSDTITKKMIKLLDIVIPAPSNISQLVCHNDFKCPQLLISLYRSVLFSHIFLHFVLDETWGQEFTPFTINVRIQGIKCCTKIWDSASSKECKLIQDFCFTDNACWIVIG